MGFDKLTQKALESLADDLRTKVTHTSIIYSKGKKIRLVIEPIPWRDVFAFGILNSLAIAICKAVLISYYGHPREWIVLSAPPTPVVQQQTQAKPVATYSNTTFTGK